MLALAVIRNCDPTPSGPAESFSIFFSDGIHRGHSSGSLRADQILSGVALISVLLSNLISFWPKTPWSVWFLADDLKPWPLPEGLKLIKYDIAAQAQWSNVQSAETYIIMCFIMTTSIWPVMVPP